MAAREPSWCPYRTVAAKLEDPRVLTGSGNWFGELSRWSNLPRKILMTMSRVKDTAELFVSTFELNLAGTRLVPHSWRRPLQLHNCRRRRPVLDGRYCKSGQGTAHVRPPQPPVNPLQPRTCFWCNSGAAKPWLQCRDHSLGAHSFHEKCPCRLVSIERTDGGPFHNWDQNEKTIQYWNQIEKHWLNHFDVQNVCCAGQLFIFLSSYLVVVR